MAIRGIGTALQYAQLPLQGATFGLADEIQGGMGAIRGYLDPMSQGTLNPLEALKKGYETGTGQAREQIAAAREATPKTALALEVAGALPMAAGAARQAFAKPGMLMRVLRGMGSGAKGGGYYGAGGADGGIPERVMGAGYGTMGGGIVGGPAAILGGAQLGGTLGKLLQRGLAKGATKQFSKGLASSETTGYLGGQNGTV